MRTHRTIWYVTGVVVVFTAVFLTARKAGEEPGDIGAPPARVPSEREKADIDRMLSLLGDDPSMENAATCAAVRSVAALGGRGGLDTAETLYAMGLRDRLDGSFDTAERAYRRAIALKPDWSWPYVALGIMLGNHAEGRAIEAEEAFRTAIRLDPEWSRPHNDLAILLRLNDRLDEAEQEARIALSLDPDNVANRNNYGNLLTVQERLDEAEGEYRAAIRLDPSHPKPYYNLACLYSLRHEKAKALPLLKKAIALNPDLREDAAKDPDLDNIRDDPEFRALVYGAEPADKR